MRNLFSALIGSLFLSIIYACGESTAPTSNISDANNNSSLPATSVSSSISKNSSIGDLSSSYGLIVSSLSINSSSNSSLSSGNHMQQSSIAISSSIAAISSSIQASCSSITTNYSSAIVSSSSYVIIKGQIIDGRDNATYNTVQIGSQIWISENIKFDTLDGTGSKCYNNDVSNCSTYGRLYNWTTATKVCPNGSHLPSLDEWNQLLGYVNNDISKLKSNSGWNYSGNGTDDYGFSALPAGNLYLTNFDGLKTGATWWSSTECCTGNNYAETIYFPYSSSHIISTGIKSDWWLTVRCIIN